MKWHCEKEYKKNHTFWLLDNNDNLLSLSERPFGTIFVGWNNLLHLIVLKNSAGVFDKFILINEIWYTNPLLEVKKGKQTTFWFMMHQYNLNEPLPDTDSNWNLQMIIHTSHVHWKTS